MRIAMLAPISWRVPPRHYGPWELVVSNLTEALVARGLEVTLFATADSITKARLASIAPRPYSEDRSLIPKVWECLHISEVFERAAGFDLIHNHFDYLPLTYSGLVRTPLLTTIHGFSSKGILPVYEKYSGRTHYVAISEADRAPGLAYIRTIHHGIRIEEFAFSPQPEGYLLFFGRIHPEKGAAEAIRAAKECGKPLILAGIIQDEAYFANEVEPHLDGNLVKYIGPVGPDRRSQLLGGAAALLHLISFEEPFGLSVAEALACGTPVIATRRGSMPELIRDGIDGYLVASPEDAPQAVSRAAELDRQAIRKGAIARFSLDRMADEYISVYNEILGS